MNILLVAGFSSDDYLSAIYREDDGRSDFLISLINLFASLGTIHSSLRSVRRSQIDLEIHIDCQIPRTSAKRILFYFEDINVRPNNFFARYASYSKVFSIFECPIKGKKVTYLPYPHEMEFNARSPSFSERTITASMFATNRNVIFNCSNSLYNQRQHVINQFEIVANLDFRLFGRDWDRPFVKCGIFPRLVHEFRARLPSKYVWFGQSRVIKNWHGFADKKNEILKMSKFNFCFENIYGLDGYISEKLLDSLSAGSVPIYYPSFPIAEETLPAALYYDYRDFESFEALTSFITNFDENAYQKWRRHVDAWLPKLKRRHSIQTFIDRIKDEIADI